MLAFHNDPKIKAKYLKRVKAHAKADKIVKGQYWEGGKGCAVGCTIHGSTHKKYEDELGIPESIARLEDTIFEGLPNELAMTFPVRFLEAIPVGADLSHVATMMQIFSLRDCRENALEDGKAVIDLVIEALEGEIHGEKTPKERWAELESAAKSAAESAAWSAKSAAKSAAWSARSAAESAAWSAAWSARSAAKSAAESAAYIRLADELIRLLSEAPTPKQS